MLTVKISNGVFKRFINIVPPLEQFGSLGQIINIQDRSEFHKGDCNLIHDVYQAVSKSEYSDGI